MSASYHLCDGYILFELGESFTVGQVVQSLQSLIKDLANQKGLHLLIDGRNADTTKIYSRNLRYAAILTSPIFKEYFQRIVIVAPSPPQYGIARMFCVYASSQGVSIQVCKNLEEAIALLSYDTGID
jgi:hypothetical protein